MDYINLGRTGLKVSRICLGAMTYGDPGWREWVLPEEASRPFIKRALEMGINETPIEETLEALNDPVRVGKVRYLGASSM